MTTSTPRLPDDRLAIGQLLIRLLSRFRNELFDQPEREDEFPGIRFSHLAIWGNIGIEGIRLTDLADRANLSLAACSEQISELERLGYLERRPDPSDGRAKLVYPTDPGLRLLGRAGQAVAAIESHWRELLPDNRFNRACYAFDALLRALDDEDARL